MKIVSGSIAVSALMISVAGAAYAQQSGNAGGVNGAQSDAGNNAGVAAGTNAGIGAGPSPMPGVGTSVGTARSAGSGPVLNNMRANGTSLDMNPDPRAPNLTGKPSPLR